MMGESSEIALTYARIFLRELEPKNEFLDHVALLQQALGPRLPESEHSTQAHIHMNMPEGAIPKELLASVFESWGYTASCPGGWAICRSNNDISFAPRYPS